MKTRQLVPMAFVSSLERSIEFYGYLGFQVRNTFTAADSSTPTWAWLESDAAPLMLALATHPIIPEQQRVLFYVYTDDVASARATLIEVGLEPGAITTPFYAPRGEFQIADPDGFVVMVTHN